MHQCITMRVSCSTLEVSTRWQLGWAQPLLGVSNHVNLREQTIAAVAVTVSAAPLNSAGPLSPLAVNVGLWNSVGLSTAVGYPYSVIAAQPQVTQCRERQGAAGVNDVQGMFCTNILWDFYCKANPSFSVPFLICFISVQSTLEPSKAYLESHVRGVTPEGFICTLTA